MNDDEIIPTRPPPPPPPDVAPDEEAPDETETPPAPSKPPTTTQAGYRGPRKKPQSRRGPDHPRSALRASSERRRELSVLLLRDRHDTLTRVWSALDVVLLLVATGEGVALAALLAERRRVEPALRELQTDSRASLRASKRAAALVERLEPPEETPRARATRRIGFRA
jgi:hypothetical protein